MNVNCGIQKFKMDCVGKKKQKEGKGKKNCKMNIWKSYWNRSQILVLGV